MKKWLTGPRLVGSLALLALAIAVAMALRTPPVPVEVTEVTRGPLVVTVDDLGETRLTDLYAVSAPVTGQLQRVPLKPGHPVVARATVLARIIPVEAGPLDPRSTAQAEANVRALSAQLNAARSRVAEAVAQQRFDDREFARVQSLAARGFVSQATLDRSRASRDRTRAAVAEARQSLNAAAASLDAARAALIASPSRAVGRGSVVVTSPVPGRVLRVPQESERVVVAGTPIVEVGDPDRLEIVTDLLSSDAVQVRPGASVVIEDWGGDRPLRGRVRLIEPFGFTKFSALGVEEQRVNVVIDFAEPRKAWERLGHGYRATVRIEVWSKPQAVRVPVSALFRSGGKWSVFRIDDGGRARLTLVDIGRMNDELAEVRRGLAPGTKVIAHPSDKVAEGVRVEPR